MVPIILQTFNRINYSQQVIATLNNYILHSKQIIVIDNGSTDGTPEYLELMLKLKIIDYLILNKENKGIAEPKNQGLEIVKELDKIDSIRYVCITDNDITPPFIRSSDRSCVMTEIIKIMDNHPEVGMCGVDLCKDNAPNNQEWWWRLRQHPQNNPTFAEISIGFWFAVFRYEHLKDFKFEGESKYGKVDESIRNYLGLVKKMKIGVLKGIFNGKETISKVGVHLGWREDVERFPEYVAMKKQERFKAEQSWKEKNRKW